MPRKRLIFVDIYTQLKHRHKVNECWPWPHLDTRGYGRLGGKLDHRLSYEHENGLIKEKLHVCHSCDNPACVNPKHLWLGTDNDNIQDMRRKGRQRYIGSHKLTTSELLKIKNSLRTLPKRRSGRVEFYKTLAKPYNVCWQHIRELANGKIHRKMDV